MAVDGSSKPVLCTPNNIPWPLILTPTWTDVIAEGSSSSERLGEVVGFQVDLDPGLAAVWAAMSEFCAVINAVAENKGTKMTEEVFLHSMGSIMYRLLHQNFEIGSLDEVFRFGLLAFGSPLFLNWNRIELPDLQFTLAFRNALSGLNQVEQNVAPRERLWLLMIAALSMSHEPEGIAWLIPWLQIEIEQCEVATWDDMRDLLRSILWVSLIYDKPAKDIFDVISSQQTSDGGPVCRTTQYQIET
jgi:hypothetical protein